MDEDMKNIDNNSNNISDKSNNIMNYKLELVKELYHLTVRCQNAVNLGLVPRFMRLLKEREVIIKKLEKLEVEKQENLMYDEIEKQIEEYAKKIIDLDKINMKSLSMQKISAKKDLEKVINTRKVMLETYEKENGVVGNYFDNKQ